MALRIQETRRRGNTTLDPAVARVANALVSPFVGSIRRLQCHSYEEVFPALCTVGPEISDIHRRDQNALRPQYHCAGFGFSMDEAMIKALGEAAERSAIMTFQTARPSLIERAMERDLLKRGAPFVSLREFARFAPEQYTEHGFRFAPHDPEAEIGWLSMIHVPDGEITLLPAQTVLNNYLPLGEERVALSVSTGSATHGGYELAMMGAISELLQVDAAMGYWYSGQVVPRIQVDEQSLPRFHSFTQRFSRWLTRPGISFEFYYMQQVDGIPIHIVACAMRSAMGFPALLMGMGASLDLESALYASLLECIPVTMLAMITSMRQAFPPEAEASGDGYWTPKTPLRESFASMGKLDFNDLDMNVGYYAIEENASQVVPGHFDPSRVIHPDEIRRLVATPPAEEGWITIVREASKKHRLFLMDLTTDDWRAVKFKIVRFRSPDLLQLCLPSMPEAAHPRFDAYGGFRTFRPHPYP